MIYLLALLLLAYIGYSWYWQATIEIHGRYRLASIIWAIIFIWVCFAWNYINFSTTGLPILLAIFLLMSIMDGNTGFSKTRIVVSGYLKRTVKFSDIDHIKVMGTTKPNGKGLVIVAFQSKGRTYYIRFSKAIDDVIQALQKCVRKDVGIEVDAF
ncbi:hypothetical protein [Lactobacillus psittaci]|uniref:hypothetical protein n=1 Tax=Lactobacillus psittaci TaxID=116089 RepID=UPI00040A5036|nr:hypothetical protein [Lactobacillus psittaci]